MQSPPKSGSNTALLLEKGGMERCIRAGSGTSHAFQSLHSLEIFDTLFKMTKKTNKEFFSWNFTENENEMNVV